MCRRMTRCCGILRRSGKASTFDQTIVILRHSERADHIDSSYLKSEEGQKWPYDAPLTERGFKLAAEVAENIAVLHETYKFAAIACSPYRRCLETASVVAELLKLPVILDQEIGEHWGADTPKEPLPFRTGMELKSLVHDLGIKPTNPINANGLKLFGKLGKWPETLDDAKSRYLVRIEYYIELSLRAERNYILITHADAVTAAVHMFGHGNIDVTNVDYCAQVTAKRAVKIADKSRYDQIYDEKWEFTTSAITQEILPADGASMAKLYEKQHRDNVAQTTKATNKRNLNRSKTDDTFEIMIRSIDDANDVYEDVEGENETMSARDIEVMETGPPRPRRASLDSCRSDVSDWPCPDEEQFMMAQMNPALVIPGGASSMRQASKASVPL